MSAPRYEPRHCTSARRLFGSVPQIPWLDVEDLPEGITAAQGEAAKMQHAYAIVIRQRMKDTFDSQAEYARAAGTSQERLSNVLRGAAIMRLEDMALAHRLLRNVHQAGMRMYLSGAIDTAASTGPH